jgi:fatty acid-binding protein DegV
MTVRVGLATDSTADVQPDLLERQVVEVVPLVINWDRQTYRDKVDLPSAEFYRRLRGSKSLPKTGAPSLAAFEDDSGTFTRGLGWMLEAAAWLATAGADAEEIARVVAGMKPRVRIFAILDTLEYLQRGGRIGRAAAFAGTLLNVKPILEITDGEVHPVERVRTLNGAIRRLVETVVRLGDVERLAVMHGDAEAGARELERQLQPHVPRLAIEHGEIGSVLGVHAGPGVIGTAVLLAG